MPEDSKLFKYLCKQNKSCSFRILFNRHSISTVVRLYQLIARIDGYMLELQEESISQERLAVLLAKVLIDIYANHSEDLNKLLNNGFSVIVLLKLIGDEENRTLFLNAAKEEANAINQADIVESFESRFSKFSTGVVDGIKEPFRSFLKNSTEIDRSPIEYDVDLLFDRLSSIPNKSNVIPHIPILLSSICEAPFFSEKTQKQYAEFLRFLSDSISKHKPENYECILLSIWPILIQNFYIMEENAAFLFKQALTAGISGLDRYCKQFYIIDRNTLDVLKKFYLFIDNKGNEVEFRQQFELLLTIFSAIAQIDGADGVCDVIKQATQGSLTITSVNKTLGKTLVSALFSNEKKSSAYSQIDVNICEKVLERVGAKKLAKLIMASRSMHNNSYRMVYLDILRLTLLDDGAHSLYEYLHDVYQEEGTLGLYISQHNDHIQALLLKHGVYSKEIRDSPTKYDKKLYFRIEADPAIESPEKPRDQLLTRLKEGETVKLYDAIESLISELKSIDHQDVSQAVNYLESVISMLDEIKRGALRFNPQKADIFRNKLDKFGEEERKKTLDVLSKICERFPELDEPVRECLEFSKHLFDLFKDFKNLSVKKNKKAMRKSQSRDFVAEQADKYSWETLFIANEVGCCLAVGAAQFPAMIQRILDDAMQFHVVRDLDTNKVVALAWIYFATFPADLGDEVKLVANFFEINKNYTQDNSIKMGLLRGLLEFTQQFCFDNDIIDASGEPRYMLAQLKYGDFVGDLEGAFPLEQGSRPTDKLGGAFVPNEANLGNGPTVEFYYLNSLKNEQWHRFTRQGLVTICPRLFKKVEPPAENTVGSSPGSSSSSSSSSSQRHYQGHFFEAPQTSPTSFLEGDTMVPHSP